MSGERKSQGHLRVKERGFLRLARVLYTVAP